MDSFFETFANRAVADAWLVSLIPVLVKSVVILGVAGVVAHVLKNSAAALRHLVWLTAIGGILFLPAMTRVLPTIEVPIANNLVESTERSVAPNASRTTDSDPILADAPESRTAVAGSQRTTNRAESPTTAAPGGVSGVITNLKAVPWTVWFFAAWIAGTIVLLVRLVLSHLSAFALVRRSTIVHDDDLNLRLERHARRLSVHRRVRLRESEWLDVPVTVGSIRPVVLVPRESAEWDDATRDAVLLHELAHIRRLDCLAQTVVEAVRAVLWVNPLTWIAESEMRVERERACDDLVITSGTRASTYAQTLLELAGSIRGRDRTSAAVMAMARRSDLEGRLLDILDDGPRLRNVNRVGAALAILVVFSFVLPVAALSPSAAADSARDDATDRAPSKATFELLSDELLASELSNELSIHDLSAGDFLPDELLPEFGDALNERLARALNGVSGLDNADEFMSEVLNDISAAMAELEYEINEAGIVWEPTDRVSSDTLTIDQLIQLARHGVDAEYIDELRSAGYGDLSFETLMAFARHGIDADYISELAQAGLPSLPADDLVSFSRHGVDADMVGALRRSGFSDLTADDVIDLARHGVDEDDIAGYGELGFSNLSAEQLINLSRHGVDPHEMRVYMDLGFKNIGIEEYIDLARHGVDEDLVVSLAASGYKDLGVDALVSLSRHGVDDDMIAGLRAQGYDNLTVDEIVYAARQGLDAECIEAINAAGYGRFSLETLVQFARYDVDAEFLEDLVEAGVDDLTSDELIKLRKNGISAEFIKKVRNDR